MRNLVPILLPIVVAGWQLAAAPGDLRWQFQTRGFIRSTPAVGADGTVYFCSGEARLYALAGTNPLADCPWPKFRGDATQTAQAEFGGPPQVLAPAGDHFVAAGSTVTLGTVVGGERPVEVLWEFPCGEANWLSSPIALGEDAAILCLTAGPRWCHLDALDGVLRTERKLWFLPQHGGVGQMTLGPRGQAYFVMGRPLNKLVAIHGTSGLAQSAWPTARGDAGNTGLGRGLVWIEGPGFDLMNFHFKVQTIPRNTYPLQVSPSLEPPQWMSVNSIEGDGSKRVLADPEPLDSM